MATALADKEEPHRWWSTHRAPAGHSRKPRPHAAAPTTGSQSSTRPTALDDGSDPRAAAWQSPVRMRIGQRQRLPQAPRALAGVGPFGRHLSRNRFRDERLPLSRRRHLALGAVAFTATLHHGLHSVLHGTQKKMGYTVCYKTCNTLCNPFSFVFHVTHCVTHGVVLLCKVSKQRRYSAPYKQVHHGKHTPHALTNACERATACSHAKIESP